MRELEHKKQQCPYLAPYFKLIGDRVTLDILLVNSKMEELESKIKQLNIELANVRREAIYAINKAQIERAEQIAEEADLNGYSRGVADTEYMLANKRRNK